MTGKRITKVFTHAFAAVACIALMATWANAAGVPLQNATSDAGYVSGGYAVANILDNVLTGANGWHSDNSPASRVIVVETASDLNDTSLTFTITQNSE